ncbi:hypothetical protein R3P38DRAFT_3374093 [Favolaschia claudopus]|uniref:Uncharacterized protein n=1 Tax=Favolaschia claudopus TaxID=2862362 RepID=A0AAV9ZPN5_9AGAR
MEGVHTACITSPDRHSDSLEEPSVTTKRQRGRPKGSKNKPKEPPELSQASSQPTLSPPAKKKRSEESTNVSNETNITQSSATRSFSGLARGLLRPRTPPGQQHYLATITPATSTTSATTSPALDTPPEAPNYSRSSSIPAATPANVSSTHSRVRQIAAGAGDSSPLPSTTSSNSIGIITDVVVEQECDSRSFINGDGLGEEEDDDPHPGKPKHKFPDWFEARLAEIHGELKRDLNSLAGRSGHYTNGTFWIPQTSSWFRQNQTNLQPHHIFTCDFFLWDPLRLLGPSFALPCGLPYIGLCEIAAADMNSDDSGSTKALTWGDELKGSGGGGTATICRGRVVEVGEDGGRTKDPFKTHMQCRTGEEVRRRGWYRSGRGSDTEVAGVLGQNSTRRWEERGVCGRRRHQAGWEKTSQFSSRNLKIG